MKVVIKRCKTKLQKNGTITVGLEVHDAVLEKHMHLSIQDTEEYLEIEEQSRKMPFNLAHW